MALLEHLEMRVETLEQNLLGGLQVLEDRIEMLKDMLTKLAEIDEIQSRTIDKLTDQYRRLKGEVLCRKDSLTWPRRIEDETGE